MAKERENAPGGRMLFTDFDASEKGRPEPPSLTELMPENAAGFFLNAPLPSLDEFASSLDIDFEDDADGDRPPPGRPIPRAVRPVRRETDADASAAPPSRREHGHSPAAAPTWAEFAAPFRHRNDPGRNPLDELFSRDESPRGDFAADAASASGDAEELDADFDILSALPPGDAVPEPPFPVVEGSWPGSRLGVKPPPAIPYGGITRLEEWYRPPEETDGGHREPSASGDDSATSARIETAAAGSPGADAAIAPAAAGPDASPVRRSADSTSVMTAFADVDLDALWEEKLDHSRQKGGPTATSDRAARVSEELFADIDLDAAWREKKRGAASDALRRSPGKTHAALPNPTDPRFKGAAGAGDKDSTLILKPHADDKEQTLILDPDGVAERTPPPAPAASDPHPARPAAAPAGKTGKAARKKTAPGGRGESDFDFADLIDAVGGYASGAAAEGDAGEDADGGLTADALIASLDLDGDAGDGHADVKPPVLDDTAIMRPSRSAAARLAGDPGETETVDLEVADAGGHAPPPGAESWDNATDTVDLEDDYLPEAERPAAADTVDVSPVPAADVPAASAGDVAADTAPPPAASSPPPEESDAPPVAEAAGDDALFGEDGVPGGEAADAAGEASAPDGAAAEAEVAVDPMDVFANMGDMDFGADDGLDDEMRAMLEEDADVADEGGEGGDAAAMAESEPEPELPAGRLARFRFRLRRLAAGGGVRGLPGRVLKAVAWRENWWFYCDLLAAVIATASLAVIISYYIWYR